MLRPKKPDVEEPVRRHKLDQRFTRYVLIAALIVLLFLGLVGFGIGFIITAPAVGSSQSRLNDIQSALSASHVVQGTYGSLTEVPVLTIGSNGLVLNASIVNATPAATASTYATRDSNAASAFGSATLGGTSQQSLQFIAGTTPAAGIAFGTDTSPAVPNLYRSAAGTLRTDGIFSILPTVNGALPTPFLIGSHAYAYGFDAVTTWNVTGQEIAGAYVANNLNNSLIGTNALATAVINSGGTNYTVGDLLIAFGGNSNSQLQVTSIDNTTGAIVTLLITRGGSGYSTANGVSLAGGTGTNATANITAATQSWTNMAGLAVSAIAAPNNGYSTASILRVWGIHVGPPDLGLGPMTAVNIWASVTECTRLGHRGDVCVCPSAKCSPRRTVP